MSTETEFEIYRALRSMQAKHTYFLLMAAAGGIALAASQTQGVALSLRNIALVLALGFWGLSFFHGCRYVNYVSSELYLSQKLWKVQAGEYPDIGENPALVTLAEERIRQAMYGNSRKASSSAAWQFRLLIWGGVLYVAWLVVEMYLKQLK